MKNIIIFSSLCPTKKECARVNSHIKNGIIAHIPTSYLSTNMPNVCRPYVNMGFKKTFTFPLGINYDKERLDLLMKSDAIHIGGGNTFELLFLLRHRGMIDLLREYVNNGGILMGNSAGGIVMCNQIRIAGFADENYLGMEDLNSLGLVDFEVKPHWEYWKKFKGDFENYIEATGETLFCLRETESIWVTENSIKFYGGMPEKIGDGSYNWKMKVIE